MDPFPFCCSTTYDSPILWPEDPRIRRVAQTERNAPRACFVMLRFLDVRDEERHCHPGLCDSKSQSWPSRKPREERKKEREEKMRNQVFQTRPLSYFILISRQDFYLYNFFRTLQRGRTFSPSPQISIITSYGNKI